MPIYASDPGGGERELVPPGWHLARCVQVIDLQLQINQWGEQHKLALVFEVPDLPRDDGPAVITWFGRLSLHKKSNLLALLERWRGRPFTQDELARFDVAAVAGAAAAVSVKHVARQDGSLHDEVDLVAAPQPGTQVPPASKAPLVIDWDAPDIAQRLAALSDGMRAMAERGRRNLLEREAARQGQSGYGHQAPPQSHQPPPPPSQGQPQPAGDFGAPPAGHDFVGHQPPPQGQPSGQHFGAPPAGSGEEPPW